MPSIFSKIIAGEIPSYKIAENNKFFAFLDISPMAKGHTLVVPKVEIDDIFDIDDNLLAEMMLFSKKVATAIKTTLACKRVGLMVVGLDVPHAHIHLIPITKASDMSLASPKLEFSKIEFQDIANSISNNIQL